MLRKTHERIVKELRAMLDIERARAARAEWRDYWTKWK